MVVLDAVRGRVSIYSGGYTLIHRIDTAKLLQSVTSGPSMSDLKVVDLSDANGSNIQLHLSDGSQKRITIRHEITDFVVNSILKVLKKILPETEYAILMQDVISLFSQVKNQTNSQRIAQNQFEVFGNFFLSLVTSGGK